MVCDWARGETWEVLTTSPQAPTKTNSSMVMMISRRSDQYRSDYQTSPTRALRRTRCYGIGYVEVLIITFLLMGACQEVCLVRSQRRRGTGQRLRIEDVSMCLFIMQHIGNRSIKLHIVSRSCKGSGQGEKNDVIIKGVVCSWLPNVCHRTQEGRKEE
jgi:hypothetical protein